VVAAWAPGHIVRLPAPNISRPSWLTQNSHVSVTTACNTKLNVTLNFGGRDWPISDEDMQFQQLDRQGTTCQGAIFDLSAGSNLPAGQGNPGWVVGDTFLVCIALSMLSFLVLDGLNLRLMVPQKNVYSVFRASNPPAVGFAELSTAAGGTGTAPGEFDMHLGFKVLG
jgi:cathepsin D